MENVRLLILDFLHSWYGVTTILGIFLIVLCRQAISDLIRKLSISFKKGDVEVQTQQSQTSVANDISKTTEYAKVQGILQKLGIEKVEQLPDVVSGAFEKINKQSTELAEAKKALQALSELKETYEFAYLNLYLVENTKLALLTLSDVGEATKKYLLSILEIESEGKESLEEKESIFSALLVSDLIETEEHGLYCVSDKGERFLRFVGLP